MSLQKALMTNTIMYRYEDEHVAVHSGQLLQDCCLHRELAAVLLGSERFLDLFQYVRNPSFLVGLHAFSTLQVK